jgi:hypothetical protein
MCDDHEDWRHVLTCNSLDADLTPGDSWSKVYKMMDMWSLPIDIWTTMENGIHHKKQTSPEMGSQQRAPGTNTTLWNNVPHTTKQIESSVSSTVKNRMEFFSEGTIELGLDRMHGVVVKESEL